MHYEPQGIPTRDSSVCALQAWISLNFEPLNPDVSLVVVGVVVVVVLVPAVVAAAVNLPVLYGVSHD
jgi:hypothetical protein